MVRRRRNGYTLMEIVIAMAIFGFFVIMIAQLTHEMNGYERKLPVDFLSHPQVVVVLSRLRKDVLDTTTPYYPASFETWSQSDKTLILYSLQPTGFAETVVWDFGTKGQVRRRSFSVGNLTSDWIARGVPEFRVTDFPIALHPDSVRIVAHDDYGHLSVDQILQPRPHE